MTRTGSRRLIRRLIARPIAPFLVVGLAKVAASVAVLATGFRAVSDDDFARVVLAEAWARAPHWDATRTSWLPAPFWIAGVAMKIAGRSLDTARGTAIVLGVGAAFVVYVASRWAGAARSGAVVGASVAAAFPWSARLGVATVPELPAAALMVLALAALVPSDSVEEATGRRRLLGGAALLGATLSRYEAWPVAAVFAALCLVDTRRSARARGSLVAAAMLAVAGPCAWMASNHATHGDALHFLARVAAYRQALGTRDDGALERLVAYPVALVREAPEVMALLVAAVALAAIANRPTLGAWARRHARPAIVVAVQIAALSLAMMKDGAPTHHPERAMLTAMLLAAAAAGVLATEVLAAMTPLTGAVAAASLVTVTLWAASLADPPRLTRRAEEEAIGRAAASLCGPSERVFLEVNDYGYLAIEAAFGRPEDAVEDRSIDPRDRRAASSFADSDGLHIRVASADASWIVARLRSIPDATFGAPAAVRGSWGVFSTKAPPR